MSISGRQQTPSSEIWVSAIEKFVNLEFRNPATGPDASPGPTSSASGVSVHFFSALPGVLPQNTAKNFGFHSSHPTHPTPNRISRGPLGRRVDGDGKCNASVLDGGRSRGSLGRSEGALSRHLRINFTAPVRAVLFELACILHRTDC